MKAAVGLIPGGDATTLPCNAEEASSSRASRSTWHSGSWTSDGSADGSESCRDAAAPHWDGDDTPATGPASAEKAEPDCCAAAADSALHTWSYSDAALLPRQDSFEKKWGRWCDACRAVLCCGKHSYADLRSTVGWQLQAWTRQRPVCCVLPGMKALAAKSDLLFRVCVQGGRHD